jgi:hypothetical protein
MNKLDAATLSWKQALFNFKEAYRNSNGMAYRNAFMKPYRQALRDAQYNVTAVMEEMIRDAEDEVARKK